MEFLKRPIWRVPLVLCATGLLCRLITYLYSFVSVRIQMAQGPDPVTGAYSISFGHASVVLSAVAFLLSCFGFADLVGTVFSVFGYVSLIAMIGIIRHFAKLKKSK